MSYIQIRRVFWRHFEIPRKQPLQSDNAFPTLVNNLEQTGSTNTQNEVGVQEQFEILKIILSKITFPHTFLNLF